MTQHPTNENIIWVGTDDGNLQVTTDGGKTWTNKASAVWKTGIPDHSWVTSIEISKLNPKRMYASFDNHMYGDHGTYFAMSTDGGNTWKKFSSPEFTGFAHVIREDIRNEKLLFAGTEMGLFISLDAGANWMRSKYQNMPWYNLVRDIQIHPVTGDLLVASHGRGIYVVDDLEPLRDLVKADANADVLFFPTVDFKYDFAPQAPSTGENVAGWTEASKVVAPTFNYYLKQRSNDVVKLEVYDANNKKIKDLNGSNNKGLNKVYWPLTSNPPKVALGGFVAGSSVLYSGILGPKVPVGKYKVILKVNGKSYEQFMNVTANDAKGFSAKNMDKLYQQSMRIHAVHEKLAVLVDSMNNTMAALKKLPTRSASQQKTYDALDSMRYEILELKRQTVFFDEFKYRRRLSDLYLELAFALEPLSASKEGAITLMEKEFEEIQKKVYAMMKN